jgi:FKBP-type peptidyl-prolyl cis-trans isomerase SlyD
VATAAASCLRARGTTTVLITHRLAALNMVQKIMVLTDGMVKAFGPRDESLVRTIPKAEFPPGVKVGGTLEGVNDRGEATLFNVVKIKGPVVHLDGNHPLAGEALRFACKVMAVRQATSEEITHGHVHGDHGHHH